MKTMRQLRPPATVVWLTVGLPGLAFFLLILRGPLSSTRWVAPELFFGLVVVVTILCAIGGLAVLAIGWLRRLAEVAILGAALTVASLLSVVHGLTTPGILYGPNPAIVVSAFVSLPLAVLIAAPVIAPGWRISHAIGIYWQIWSATWVIVAAVIAAALLLDPDLIPAPGGTNPLTYAVVVVSLAGTLALGLRQLRLYRIGRRRASLVASIGFLYLGLSSLVWLSTGPFSIAWWGAHLFDATAIFAAIFGLAAAHARDRSLASTLAPVLNRDPLIALELGLTPTVHLFVAALDRKDPVTRDHVVRVGEMAMRVGVRDGLRAERLRALGLGALLHDVGKLLVRDEILTKPGKLTESEFEAMKAHTVTGSDLLRTSPILAPAADLVRWHHERIDGSGYPDGLTGDQIPIEASIISVCDAWDAMTNTRHYRGALRELDAREILREGAGSQWETRAVCALLDELEHGEPMMAPTFEQVGRHREHDREHVCLDALPDSVRVGLSTA